jgi:hypothetical protein
MKARPSARANQPTTGLGKHIAQRRGAHEMGCDQHQSDQAGITFDQGVIGSGFAGGREKKAMAQ